MRAASELDAAGSVTFATCPVGVMARLEREGLPIHHCRWQLIKHLIPNTQTDSEMHSARELALQDTFNDKVTAATD